jgi:transcriptional regulator with XRE-family HTH domain
MMTKSEFGQRLFQLMREAGYDHVTLARMADLPRTLVSSYIDGRSYPTHQSLEKLAAALGTTADDLLPDRPEDMRSDFVSLEQGRLLREQVAELGEVVDKQAGQLLELLGRCTKAEQERDEAWARIDKLIGRSE